LQNGSQTQFDMRRDPRFIHLARVMNNPSSNLAQSILKEKFALPYHIESETR